MMEKCFYFRFVIINFNFIFCNFNVKFDYFFNLNYSLNFLLKLCFGVWGLGLGDWGLWIGPNPQSPIPNPQSPIPNPHFLNI